MIAAEKMLKLIVVCVLIGATCAEFGWQEGTEYLYKLKGRTFHKAGNQYKGALIKAVVAVVPKNERTLNIEIKQGKYSQMRSELPLGWDSKIPKNETNYRSLDFSGKPFVVKMRNGTVSKLTFSENLPTWEVNFVKSIASNFQVNTQGKSLEGLRKIVYATEEDSINGKCETIYEVSTLPNWVVETHPESLEMEELRNLEPVIVVQEAFEVVKTKNYSNCDQPNQGVVLFGVNGSAEWKEATEETLGPFKEHISTSRVVISGTLNDNIVETAVSTETIVLDPSLYEGQENMLISSIGFALQAVRPSFGRPQSVPNPQKVNDLTYVPASGRDKTSSSSSSSSESK